MTTDSAISGDATISLFDDHGRRIPYRGVRVYNSVSRRYFRLERPHLDYSETFERTVTHLLPGDLVTQPQFEAACGVILDALRADRALANLLNGVFVPFLCPPLTPGMDRTQDFRRFLHAIERSFTERYPGQDFLDLCPGFPAETTVLAKGSRYQEFEDARRQGAVAGLYFPACLAEYDLASQRGQMSTLPETLSAGGSRIGIALSGAVDAASALVGSPGLLQNETSYPHHLCLSALQEPGDRVLYTFEAYGRNLRFRQRSNMLTPALTQVSEQWAGGLTVYLALA